MAYSCEEPATPAGHIRRASSSTMKRKSIPSSISPRYPCSICIDSQVGKAEPRKGNSECNMALNLSVAKFDSHRRRYMHPLKYMPPHLSLHAGDSPHKPRVFFWRFDCDSTCASGCDIAPAYEVAGMLGDRMYQLPPSKCGCTPPRRDAILFFAALQLKAHKGSDVVCMLARKGCKGWRSNSPHRKTNKMPGT